MSRIPRIFIAAFLMAGIGMMAHADVTLNLIGTNTSTGKQQSSWPADGATTTTARGFMIYTKGLTFDTEAANWGTANTIWQSSADGLIRIGSLPFGQFAYTFPLGIINEGSIRSASGNARGTNAMDFQLTRSAATQVASGNAASIVGGKYNTASGAQSTAGGYQNTASGTMAGAIGGYGNTASGDYSTAIGGWTNTASAENAATVGGRGNTAAAARSSVLGGGGSGVGNSIISGSDNSVIAGGNSNTITNNATESFIGGGTSHQITAASGFIGGGSGNDVTASAGGVLSGQANTVSGAYSGIVAGATNTASGVNSAIGAGDTNLASGLRSFIGGGIQNQATGEDSSICGAYNSVASGQGSFIGGGFDGLASGICSVVAGGGHYTPDNNIASGDYSGILSGQSNRAAADRSIVCGGGGVGTPNTVTAGAVNSVIGGGVSNTIGATGTSSFIGAGGSNQASGTSSGILSGSSNTAQGANSAVLGGDSNNAVGIDSSVICGATNGVTGYASWAAGTSQSVGGDVAAAIWGDDCTASANYSAAGGRRASATHEGSIVLSDSQNAAFASTTTDQFRVRYQNGFENTGAVTAVKSYWRYLSAVACARGDIVPDSAYVDHTHGATGLTWADDQAPTGHDHSTTNFQLITGTMGGSTAATTLQPAFWAYDMHPGATYLVSNYSDGAAYFALDLVPGSVITDISVKWQAGGNNDGVKLRLLKRDETAVTTAWSVVGVQQTYVDAGTPFPVTLSSYTLPATETVAEGYSYQIEVQSVVATSAAYLYAVGYKTSARSL